RCSYTASSTFIF
nr:immunoglobulin light chain junction region [Macaca mulatta]